MGKGSSVPTVGGAKPRPRELRSAGAAVARSVAAMAKPTKLAVVLKETGGSDTIVVSKGLRGGERVLSGPINRYETIADHPDADIAAAAPAAGNPNLAAVPNAHLAADAAQAAAVHNA